VAVIRNALFFLLGDAILFDVLIISTLMEEEIYEKSRACLDLCNYVAFDHWC
jgi:hypothetical protein